MAGFTYSTLTTAIGNYTEVGTSVLSSTITDQFIDNSELRIQREIPIDAASYSLKKLISFFSKKLLAPVAAVVEV